MKCFIGYSRLNTDTISGERIIVTQTYSTFDTAEMDRFEDYLRKNIASGISVEYDIDKCMENEEKERVNDTRRYK